MRLAVAALLAMVTLSGCAGPDGLRRQFVAMRYLQTAEARLRGLPRETDLAIAELDRAMELLPDDEGLRERAGPMYVAARAWDKALPLLRERAGENRQVNLLLAQCLLATGRAKEGSAICRAALREADELHGAGHMSAAEFALALNDAGYVLGDAGQDLERAEEAVQKAVDLHPLQAAFVDSLGWVLYRQGNHLDAAFYLERALRLSPREDPEMLYHLGAAYARLGRLSDARDMLDRAAEADPSWPVIQKELRRLGRTLLPPGMTT